jgi:hypothetical protein
LTKVEERFINEAVKKAAFLLSGLASVAAVALVLRLISPLPLRASTSTGQETGSQEVQKPKYDYMNNFLLSRSTRPLGLREDPDLRKRLNQGAVRWAIRAGSRQLLD